MSKVIDSYEGYLDKKGDLDDWTDTLILKTRDRFRKIARKHRGDWSFRFYEYLQDLNKESTRRDLNQETK